VNAPSTPWYNRIYGYDALNRLTHAEGPWGDMDYTYDHVGNRLTKTEDSVTDTYAYIIGTNILDTVTNAETTTYTHDANGNITGIDNKVLIYNQNNKVLIYNQNNRLIRVEENSVVLGEYTYNGLGQRIIKEAGGVAMIFHYDFDGNIIGESDLSGNFDKEYLYRGSSRLALVDASTGELYYYGNDRLGTPQILTDSTNTVVWEAEYKPFGEADVNPNSTVVNNFRFPGQYFDQETGFHYNYHRYYDPRTGRYLRPDPIGQFGGVNLFIYSHNNPCNNTDPEGLWVIIPFLVNVAQKSMAYIIPLTPYIPSVTNIFDKCLGPWGPGIPEVIEGGKSFRRNYERWKSKRTDDSNICESRYVNSFDLSPNEIAQINRRAQYLASEMRIQQIQRGLEIWYKEIEERRVE
jgi:RHS repeat-associated protein